MTRCSGLHLAAFAVACAMGCTDEPSLDPRVEVVARPRRPNGVAVDASFVYWTDGERGGGTIWRAAKDGRDPEALVTHDLDASSPFVDATGVWSSTGIGIVHVAPMGAITFLQVGIFSPGELVGDGTALYSVDSFHQSIAKIAFDGTLTLIADEMPDEVVGLAVDETGVYWTVAAPTTRVFRAAKPDLMPEQIAELPEFPRAIALGTDRLYIASATDVTSVRASDGGDRQTVTTVVDDPQGIDAIAISGEDLLVHTSGCGGVPEKVLRAPRAGGDAVELGTYEGCLDLAGFAVDASHVYVGSAAPNNAYFSGGGLFRVAR